MFYQSLVYQSEKAGTTVGKWINKHLAMEEKNVIFSATPFGHQKLI